MNFGDLRNVVLSRVRDFSLSSFVPAWFNEVQDEMSAATHWRHLQDRIIIPTKAPYTAGTVTATNGLTTVTGSGTAWVASDIGQLVQIGTGTASSVPYYVIVDVDPVGQTITLGSAYIGDTGSGISYSIYYYQLELPTRLSIPKVLLASMQQSNTFHYPLRYIGEHELFNLVPNEIYVSQRPWLFRIYGGSYVQLFPPPSDVANVSIWFIRYPTQIPLDGTETGNEVLDWPLETHYGLAKLTESKAWAYLHDTEADAAEAAGMKMMALHIKENNKIPISGLQLTSWDNAAGSQVNPLQYPRTLG